MPTDYAIIGGGIAGASIAFHLSEQTDKSITLYERESPATETTAKSVAQYGFYGDQTQHEMKRYGMKLYNRFFRNSRTNPRYESMGILAVATDDENAIQMDNALAAGNDGQLDKIGEGFDRDLVEYIPSDELEETLLLPPVDTERINGALYRPKVGYMSRPQELVYEFLERAKDNGVEIEQNTEITEIQTKDEQVRGFTTRDGTEIETNEVICSAGPWNIRLARSAGVELPVKHTIAPILKLRPNEPVEYSLPAINHYESPYAFHRRSPEELLIGYNPDYDTATEYDPDEVSDTVPDEICDDGFDLLEELVPGFTDAELVDEWVGIRSVTPDGNPVIGWTELEGFSIAAFHTSGIQLAPAVGKMIADQLLHGDRTSHYDALSISRFDGYNDHRT